MLRLLRLVHKLLLFCVGNPCIYVYVCVCMCVCVCMFMCVWCVCVSVWLFCVHHSNGFRLETTRTLRYRFMFICQWERQTAKMDITPEPTSFCSTSGLTIHHGYERCLSCDVCSLAICNYISHKVKHVSGKTLNLTVIPCTNLYWCHQPCGCLTWLKTWCHQLCLKIWIPKLS